MGSWGGTFRGGLSDGQSPSLAGSQGVTLAIVKTSHDMSFWGGLGNGQGPSLRSLWAVPGKGGGEVSATAEIPFDLAS